MSVPLQVTSSQQIDADSKLKDDNIASVEVSLMKWCQLCRAATVDFNVGNGFSKWPTLSAVWLYIYSQMWIW